MQMHPLVTMEIHGTRTVGHVLQLFTETIGEAGAEALIEIVDVIH